MDNENKNEEVETLETLNIEDNVEETLDLPKAKEDNVSSAFDDMAINEEVKVEEKNKEQAPIDLGQAPIEIKEESDATTIGTIKPDKQKSPVAMLVLFTILLVFVLFMPTIINTVNSLLGTNLESHSGVVVDNSNTNEQEEEQTKEETKMYNLAYDTVINYDKLEFSNFTKSYTDKYYLSFSIKNSNTTLYTFDNKLYFDFYDETNTFISRVYLETIKQITSGVTNNYNIEITQDIYSKATKFEIIERSEDDYPEVTITNNQLTCTKDNSNLVYTFNENKRLTYLRDMYTYIKGDDAFKYTSDIIAYKSKISNLDAQDGVTAVLTETDSGFITTIAVDYASADYSKLSSDTNYYVKETLAKVISFEMNSKGYNCR